MQFCKFAGRTWFRTTAVSVLALFTLVVGAQAATILGDYLEVTDGADGYSYVHTGDQGLEGAAAGWSPDPSGYAGIWLEGYDDDDGEAGGFFANTETAAIWSPGDTDWILGVYDEDDLPTTHPVFGVTDSGGIWVGDQSTSPDYVSDPMDLGEAFFEADIEVDGVAYFDDDIEVEGNAYFVDIDTDGTVNVASATATYVDESDDLLVADDLEIDGNTYLEGNVYTYGPTSIGDSAFESHVITGILTLNQNIIVNGDATLGNGGGTMTIGADNTDSVVVNGDTDFTDDITVSDGGANAYFILDQGSSYIELGDIVGGSGLLGVDWSSSEVYVEDADFFVDNIEINSGTAIDGHVSNTATLDFGSTASGACSELTIAVSGAAANDTVTLGAPAAIEAGLTWSGFVSAADTVTVRVCNPTGGAIDPASATWRADIWSH